MLRFGVRAPSWWYTERLFLGTGLVSMMGTSFTFIPIATSTIQTLLDSARFCVILTPPPCACRGALSARHPRTMRSVACAHVQTLQSRSSFVTACAEAHFTERPSFAN